MKKNIIITNVLILSLISNVFLVYAKSNNNIDMTNMISEEKAKQIALSDANITTDKLNSLKIKTDTEHNMIIYEVEFFANGNEYDYEISATNGNIIESGFEKKYYNNENNVNKQISIDEAKQTVKNKISPDIDIKSIYMISDYDDNEFVYKGRVYYNQAEYKFEIEQKTGDVKEWKMKKMNYK